MVLQDTWRGMISRMKEATMYAQVKPLAHVWRQDKTWDIFFFALRSSSVFSSFSVVWPTQIFVIFKKKSNDVVKPFFTWNNSFNLKNARSN